MEMKSIKAKAKTKRANGRFGRVKFPNKSATTVFNPDLSNLRQPIDISITTLGHVTKLLETGSDEIKAILAYECDLVYECRICRSLFRSLANFISHKRIYCKDRFNVNFSRASQNDYDILPTEQPNSAKVAKICTEIQCNNRILRSQVAKEEQKSDLSAVADSIQSKVSDNVKTNVDKIFLQNVEANSCAVYQTVESVSLPPITESIDLMRTQVTEIEKMLKKNVAILGPDGQLLDTNHIEERDKTVQVSTSDEESNDKLRTAPPIKDITCKICNAKFATKKTLMVHTKTLHTSNRMCYPCPCCPSTFSNTWSVYRHLFKVHRKTNEQVRKLRSEIQEKAFFKETTIAEDLEKERSVKPVAIRALLRSDETQEWMEHFESSAGMQCCGGCGKHFDRKAALSSHSQHCQRRIAAFNEASSKSKKSSRATTEPPKLTEQRSIETRQRKEQEKANRIESFSSESNDSNDINIRVETVTSLSEAAWNMLPVVEATSENPENNNLIVSNANSSTEKSSKSDDARSDSSSISSSSDHQETVFKNASQAKISTVRVTGSKKRKMTSRYPVRILNSVPDVTLEKSSEDSTKNYVKESTKEIAKDMENGIVKDSSKEIAEDTVKDTGKDTIENTTMDIQKDLSQETGKTIHNTSPNKEECIALMEQKVAAISNLQKMQCLPCKRKFTSVTNLRRHVAIHIGWNRYRCKICDYKCFVKCDCVAHCNKVHNAPNDRAIVDDMIMKIPETEYGLEDTDPLAMENKVAEPESESPDIIEVDPNADLDQSFEKTVSPAKNPATTEVVVVEDSIVALTDPPIQESEPINGNTEFNRNSNTSTLDESIEEESGSKQKMRKLESDEDLRKMVMEVIFGLPEPASNQQNECESNQEIDVNSDDGMSDKPQKRAVSRAASDTSSTASSTQDNSKPQRPTRRKTKPLNNDFVYDLKEVTYRKDSIASKRSRLNRMLSKKLMEMQSQDTESAI